MGDLRNVSKTEERLKEVEKLGFKACIVPEGVNFKSDKLEVIKVSNLEEAARKGLSS